MSFPWRGPSLCSCRPPVEGGRACEPWFHLCENDPVGFVSVVTVRCVSLAGSAVTPLSTVQCEWTQGDRRTDRSSAWRLRARAETHRGLVPGTGGRACPVLTASAALGRPLSLLLGAGSACAPLGAPVTSGAFIMQRARASGQIVRGELAVSCQSRDSG